MSGLLEKLKTKNTPQSKKTFTVTFSRPGFVRDESRTTEFNASVFREFLSNRFEKIRPKIQKEVSDEPEKIIIKPKKTKKRLKLKSSSIKEEKIPKLSKVVSKGTITTTNLKPKGSKYSRVLLEIPASQVVLGKKAIGKRLASKSKKRIEKPKKDLYYLPNRGIFVNFINRLFEPYKKKLSSQDKPECGTNKGDFQLMIHQQIIRDYLNLYTPYRGLLLYHGLGAGKTCGSIAIAEGLKSQNRVIVMTPASLRSNYFNEIKFCGDSMYKTNQFWEFIKYENDVQATAMSEILNIPVDTIMKNKGAFFVDNKKKSNYHKLPATKQKELDIQIEQMIMAKYQFINYNGLRKSSLKVLEQEARIDNQNNYFDNKVVIIDEAHNFVSRIVNKIKLKAKGKESLSMQLYELLLSATNCRVILLTGTPVINYPNEIGILFNLLRGYIKTFTLNIKPKNKSKLSRSKIDSILKKIKIVDYVDFKTKSQGSDVLTITRNPFGFMNAPSKGNDYNGMKYDDNSKLNDEDFLKIIKKVLSKENIEIVGNIKQSNHKALPDEFDEFNAQFIDPNTGNMIEKNKFKRRILGLTSYFKSLKELLPEITHPTDVIEVPIEMSDFQLKEYTKIRNTERTQEKNQAKMKGVFDQASSTYKIFSRVACNFVFPNEIPRPLPNGSKTLDDTIKDGKIDEDIVDNTSAVVRVKNLDGKYEEDDIDQLKKENDEKTDESYDKRIATAMQALKDDPEKYLKPGALKQYSPKFLEILRNMQDNGSHLLYSQFRTLEGVGLMGAVLEANGWVEFKIAFSQCEWSIVTDLKDVSTKNCYSLYTGTEDVEQKEIIRNIFNGDWDKVPKSITNSLNPIQKNNNDGGIIKTIMITASGAEGITLKNVRFVHLMEPYWHPVRTEQVIGRAVRICSHQALPTDERNVTVYLYIMKFSQKQIKGDPKAENKKDRDPKLNSEIRRFDRSKIDKITPVTTDQTLWEISRLKQKINREILNEIKSSAIDCNIHSSDEILCYDYGSVSKRFVTKPNISQDSTDSVSKMNQKEQNWEGQEITLAGINYILRPDNADPGVGRIYDKDSYERALTNPKAPPAQLLFRIERSAKDPTKIVQRQID